MNPDRKFLGVNVDRVVADWLGRSDNVSERVRSILLKQVMAEKRQHALHKRYQSALMNEESWTPTLKREMVEIHDVKELAVKMLTILDNGNVKSTRCRMLRYELQSFIREANRRD